VKRIFFPFLIITAVSTILLSCGSKEETQSSQEQQITPITPVVFVQDVARGTIYKTYTAVGNVAACDESRITPEVSGRIMSINVDEGDRVIKGDLLMLIDTFHYEETVANTLAVKNQARVNLERATRDLDRMKALFQQKSVSEQTYQDTVSARDLARYQHDQAAVSLEIARRNLKDCSVTAPISGIVTQKFVNEGEVASPAQLAFVIMKMDTVKVEVDLPEEVFGSIKRGNKGVVTLDALHDKSFTGEITKIYPTIDPVSRTFKVTIILKNPNLELRSGMTARSKVVQMARDDALSLPKTAIVLGEEGYFTYMVNTDTIKKVQIFLGIEGDDAFEVLDGLAHGDKVVVRGLAGLRDGMRVKTAEQENPRGE
jgi:membrane fusion protein (multidrug efflux system)